MSSTGQTSGPRNQNSTTHAKSHTCHANLFKFAYLPTGVSQSKRSPHWHFASRPVQYDIVFVPISTAICVRSMASILSKLQHDYPTAKATLRCCSSQNNRFAGMPPILPSRPITIPRHPPRLISRYPSQEQNKICIPALSLALRA